MKSRGKRKEGEEEEKQRKKKRKPICVLFKEQTDQAGSKNERRMKRRAEFQRVSKFPSFLFSNFLFVVTEKDHQRKDFG